MTPWINASTPEEAGVSSKGLMRYLDALEASGIEHHSIVVLRNGKLACKINFAPYDDQTPHILFSLSKTFASAAAGFAVSEGLLSWDSRVAEIFADQMPANPSVWLSSVTLHHLLCMGSGLKAESNLVKQTDDWVRETLAYECDAEPGTRFHYNSHGTYLVSAMVQRVSGQDLIDYLTPRLFEPLGIAKPEWIRCPKGICVGGWGMYVSSDSIARFGQCILQKGVWQGKQILPTEWIERATAAQISNAGHSEHPDWVQGYGYQIWRTRGNRFRGDGMYGQICMISPDQNMVVAITAGLNDMGKELDLLNDYLFPAADMEPGTAEEQQQLAKRLSSLAYPWPEHDGTRMNGSYALGDVSLKLDEEEARLWLDGYCYVFRLGKKCESDMEIISLGKALPVKCVTSAGWHNGQLHLLMRTLNGPFTLSAVATPRTDGMELTTEGVGVPAQTLRLMRH